MESLNSEIKNKVLKLVHVVFRHGQRTPADTYPNDPYINNTFAPYGWGHLTNKGKLDMYEMGEWLRRRYDSFLGKDYVPGLVHAQSTDVTRTKMSLELVLAGLFPPNNTTNDWNSKLNWQPIPYDYQSLDQDSLLLVRIPCPRYNEELERVFNEEPEVIKIQEDNKDLYKELTEITGHQITSPDDIQSLYSTLKAEDDYGVLLPDWTKNYYPHRLLPLAEKSYIFNVYNDELKKLKGGPFLHKLFADWESIQNNNTLTSNNCKIFLYSGHDSTIVNILVAFDLWQQQFPDYGITAIFELYEDVITKALSIKILLKKSSNILEILKVPGCGELCSLEKLKILTKHIALPLTEESCKSLCSNFIPPLSKGP